MPDDIPTYWRGDRIKRRLEVEHEVNLAGVHAIFRRQGDTYELGLRLVEGGLILTKWRGDSRISEAFLEGEVRSDTLPVDYELFAVRGKAVGAQSTPGLEFDFPQGVRFRIAAPERYRVPLVKFHEFQQPS
jgi:hypothetical protein